jgi:flavin reductase (DIM6/NTAB) family NADH-FMN oxidoreductase RutF
MHRGNSNRHRVASSLYLPRQNDHPNPNPDNPDDPDPEKAVEFDQSEGFPVVKSALAWYITKVTQLTPTGDHQMVLCAVEKLGRNEDLSPLLYYSGKYL